MTREIMLHIDEDLGTDGRLALVDHLHARFEAVRIEVRDSDKPHLLFFSFDSTKLSPHTLIQAIQDKGYHAQVVDL
ncbi:hypothetical protein Thimo_1882 [Thioflavicoccus mobilis 8321]|uniref:HMA domain-containing protein n=1 Tax=Thioflavicoccus mobilis 8321 TaxID=765912 RepID=L0GV69_9GAMM|nr:hypothetical protein [Thioflavicoccus mobilis]AGA90648.1 hypothetical protein Thimo_1882 [Thioflavicoccus mobilis 8321]